MNDDKILVVLDSNILYRSTQAQEDLSIFSLEPYDGAVGLVEIHDLADRVKVALPEIVIMEITKHKKDKLRSKISTAKAVMTDLSDIPGVGIDFQVDDDFKCDSHIDQCRAIKEKEIEIIKIPINKRLLFDTLIDMAINKIPPFKESGSDQGLKDSIILLSLEKYPELKQYKEVVLFSNDKNAFGGDQKVRICEHFINKHGVKLNIQNNENIQGFLSERFGLFIEFKEYLNKVFYPERLEKDCSEISDMILRDRVLDQSIVELDLDDEQTVINQVSEVQFELILVFNIGYALVRSGGMPIQVNNIQKKYIFTKEPGGGWKYEPKDVKYDFY